MVLEYFFNSMKTFQNVLVCSTLYNYPPIWFIGRNGIGKTTTLGYYADILPNVELGERFEMGGLEDINVIDHLTNNHVKNIFVTDLQRIMSRKYEIQYSTLDTIANTIDDVRGKNFTYRNRKNIDRKLPRLNWAIASTPQLFFSMYLKNWSWDFITRFALVFIDEKDENRGFTPLYKKEDFDYMQMRLLENTEKLGNHRHSKMFQYLKSGISSLNGSNENEIIIYFCQIDNLGQASLKPISLTSPLINSTILDKVRNPLEETLRLGETSN